MSTNRRLIETHQQAVRSLLTPVFKRLRAATPDSVAVDSPELLGRVVAMEVTTAIPLPPFDNSQMDGYAVRAEDVATASPSLPVTLTLGFTTAAGDSQLTHVPGTASPVMTGAVIPLGADAVVPVELTLPPRFPKLNRRGEPDPTGNVDIASAAPAGQFVRKRGEDAPSGAPILPAGTRLTPTRVGALAAAGCTTVQVLPRLRVLLCSTGDEISQVSEPTQASEPSQLEIGKIHDANTPMLAAALREAGAEVDTLRCGDQAGALQEALASVSASYDLIITSGGISAGAFEVVREAFAPLGAEFLSVAMQPGGPQGLGEIVLPGGAVPAVCFPGNPVSAFISAECFVLPLLREYAGLPAERPRVQRQLAHDTSSPLEKHQVRRGRIEADGRVSLSGPGSHLLSELALADVLVQLPLGQDSFLENTPVETWRIND
ncbi:molybdopterin molybdotransferase MoeA [Leucobacter viscericola]|uniref:Molybdopterin molybdenumtransferase n=1 Tax=Leucobacter viscericola TaxID=2714935 RepID=A0A6G7XD79_9MICO|nr:gephyrin-like molybdotransferase Glp [Leucobacter viscericola]QIK62515.1 molybdopterin molybdotransferase MoeA [Leucobacter viscericola]